MRTTGSDSSSTEVMEPVERIASDDIEEALDKATIASLSPIQISQMASGALIRVIRATQLPVLCDRSAERLEFCNRQTLEQLVYLARRCCRNQGY